MIYPVGSVCIRGDITDPSTVFVGTQWTRIKGRFIYGIDDGEELGVTGGESTHKLTVDEMPSHSHSTSERVPRGSNAGTYTGTSDSTIWYELINGEVTGSTGGSKPHNNMPPYKGYYIWERVS